MSSSDVINDLVTAAALVHTLDSLINVLNYFIFSLQLNAHVS